MFGAATFVRDDFNATRAAECREVLVSDDTDTFVAESDVGVTGFTAVRLDRRSSDLQDIWLHPNSWGSGAAAALVAAVEEETRSIGGVRLTSWVPEDSPSGRRFFDKLGWQATGATEPLGIYPEHPNRLFEYERILAEMDMTRGMPRPVSIAGH